MNVETTEMPRVIITIPMVGICHMQVCAVADATDEEILRECNLSSPSGTTHGWCSVCREDSEAWGKTAPVPCEQEPDRVHFLVSC